MTLPAHRFRDREAHDRVKANLRLVEDRKKKGNGKGKVQVFDYDETITSAPKQISRIAQGLSKLGDHIVVLTGNAMPHKQLLQNLDDLEFPYDDVIQYDDSGSNGVARAQYLKQLDAWMAFDNRIDRAVIFAPICPTLYLVTEATDDDEQNADGAKKDAKQAVKKLDD